MDQILPYGKGYLDCKGLETIDYQVLHSRLAGYKPGMSEKELVINALNNPIGSRRLRELSPGKKKVVILASDHTRPVPSKILMPLLLDEIRKGNPHADITILIATGCHRGTSKKELENKFGKEILEKERICIHDCDKSPLADMGLLPSGCRLLVNREAADADLLVAEGFIEPHFFAGFSGGRKSVLPGVAGRETVLANHSGHFIDSCNARTGVLKNNPIHQDMIFAARKVGLDFICNVILNGQKEIVYAVAGDCGEAHKAGCDFLTQKCKVLSKPADLVITSNGGYPMDQDIYQAVKGMTAAEAIVKKNGVIIIAAKAENGYGGEGFYQIFRKEKDLKTMISTFTGTPPSETIPDQWQAQILARVLCRASVIFISDVSDEIVKTFQMIPAHSMEEALERAREKLNKERWDTIIIPDGVSVVTFAV